MTKLDRINAELHSINWKLSQPMRPGREYDALKAERARLEAAARDAAVDLVCGDGTAEVMHALRTTFPGCPDD